MFHHRDTIPARSITQWLARLGLLCVVATSQPALSADSITGVTVSGNVGGNLGPFSRSTIDGPTHFEYTKNVDTTNFSPGAIFAEGDAHFGVLRAKVEIFGPSASYGSVGAYYSDVHTPTGGAIGTPDKFTLAFLLDGSVNTSYNGNDDPQRTIDHVARARIGVNKYTASGTNESLGGQTVEVEYSYGIGPSVFVFGVPQPYALVSVPFVYGETFTLRTSLFVEAFSDTRFLSTSGPPTFYSYGDGSIDRVQANFYDTAKLVAVVNDTTSGFSLAGQSGFNYQAIVMTEIPPVPEPSMMAMFALGCITLGIVRRRRHA